jgi:hypothetical protein
MLIRMTRILIYAMLLTSMPFCEAYVSAQAIPKASAPVCIYCGTRLPNGIHSPGCPYYVGASKTAAPKPAGSMPSHGGPSLKGAIAGTLFQSLLTSIFASTGPTNTDDAIAAEQKAAELAARQAAESQRANDAAAQAAYEEMMKSYKRLDGSGTVFKTLSDSALNLKTPGDDGEALAANARKHFDTPTDATKVGSEAANTGGPTPFFGDTMPVEDLQLLVNPENDPNVIDLRKAAAFVAENIKNGPSTGAGTKTTDGAARGEPIVRPPDCAKLAQRLNGYLNQRSQFQKTILLAQEQVETWETANRNALLNAARDGLECFTGVLVERLDKRGKAADRLARIYQKNAKQMAKDGLNIAGIEARIKRLRMLSSAGRISELTRNVADWQTFVKDGTSALLAQLTASNREIQEMFEDPGMAKYFRTEAPELNRLLDISKIAASNRVFGKWVARKVPIIAGVELSINTLYNGTDWYQSYKRLAEAHKINGGVLDAARYLQKNIDNTYIALGECPSP